MSIINNLNKYVKKNINAKKKLIEKLIYFSPKNTMIKLVEVNKIHYIQVIIKPT